MHRRAFLAAGLGGLAGGCVAAAPGVPDSKGGEGPSGDLRAAEFGNPPDICEKPIRPESGIYAILDPAFAADWGDPEIGVAYRHYRREPRLQPDQPVIGVNWDGGARAYPLSVLLHHEVVNDTTDEPLLVTFCPLCSSGMVASRVVGDEATHFAVSGQLWTPERIYAEASEDDGRVFGASYGDTESDIKVSENLVLYDDATHSYWSQLLAHAICGPLTDTDLAIRPSTVATWREWTAAHPETDVLLPPPHSETVEPGVVLGEE